MTLQWKVVKEEAGVRLFQFLRNKCPATQSSRWIKEQLDRGAVLHNGAVERFGKVLLHTGDRVALKPFERVQFHKSRILFEDERLLVYDKPPECAVVEELLPLLKKYCPTLQAVHRLDRQTSGVLLFAKGEEVQKRCEALFKARKVKKSYLALVVGRVVQQKGSCRSLLVKKEGRLWSEGKEGVPALMHFERLQAWENSSLLRCIPMTGRTHQIRVQLQGMGHPIIGDREYAFAPWNTFAPRLMLHAHTLSLTLFDTPYLWQAPLPIDMKKVERKLADK